jgi:hypothetical protein
MRRARIANIDDATYSAKRGKRRSFVGMSDLDQHTICERTIERGSLTARSRRFESAEALAEVHHSNQAAYHETPA